MFTSQSPLAACGGMQWVCGPGRERRLAPVGTPGTGSSDGPGGEDEAQIVCEEEHRPTERSRRGRKRLKEECRRCKRGCRLILNTTAPILQHITRTIHGFYFIWRVTFKANVVIFEQYNPLDGHTSAVCSHSSNVPVPQTYDLTNICVIKRPTSVEKQIWRTISCI